MNKRLSAEDRAIVEAWMNGADVEYRYCGEEWIAWVSTNVPPMSDKCKWRIKQCPYCRDPVTGKQANMDEACRHKTVISGRKWCCWRLKGHDGDHVACRTLEHDLYRWPQTPEPDWRDEMLQAYIDGGLEYDYTDNGVFEPWTSGVPPVFDKPQERYRRRPKPADSEPDVERRNVWRRNGNELLFDHRGEELPLHACISEDRWHGLEWSNGSITLATKTRCWRRMINGELEWPVAVLFRKGK